MSEPGDWQRGNDEYLAAALYWLRLRLERLASLACDKQLHPSQPSPQKDSQRDEEELIVEPFALQPEPTGRVPQEKRSGWFGKLLWWGSESPEVAVPSTPSTPPPAETATAEPQEDEKPQQSQEAPPSRGLPVTWEKIARAAEKMDEAGKSQPPPALLLLSHQLGLSRFEQDVLLLCIAMELDTRIASLCAQAQDDKVKSYPTFALAMTLFDDPAWDALSPHRPLRYWQLLEVNQSGIQSLTTSGLHSDERIVSFVKGLNYLDDRLAPLLTPVFWTNGQGDLPPSQADAVEKVVRLLGQSKAGRVPVIQLLGQDGPSEQLVAWNAASTLGLHLYRLPAELLPSTISELDTLARLWQRETNLLPIALYLDAQEVERSAGSEAASAVDRFLARVNCVLFLGSRETWPGATGLALDISKPRPEEQKEAWKAALGNDAGSIPELLAGQFNLSLADIKQITRTAGAGSAEKPLADRLWDGCLAVTRPRLDLLAQRIDAKARWDDIVLPAAEVALLRQIANQVRLRSKVYDGWGFRQEMNRGLGISALFAGESGTGKTMAAEVIANDLGLSLYRIDLSAVVSKYIGETEKNLRRLFDAAEDGGAILFFDEADALFGKRSEVKESHDRYANIEINYLLQRIESYRGLAILATNMKSSLDKAFLRRLRFIVNFPFPGQSERMIIWQKVFPEQTPQESLDFGRLAKHNLTGGSIQNIALCAAFLAASAGKNVGMEQVLEAARTELRKLERPISEADFASPGGRR